MGDNWYTTELEEAEHLFAKAQEQMRKWGEKSRESGFARQQVELWHERLMAVKWSQPGA